MPLQVLKQINNDMSIQFRAQYLDGLGFTSFQATRELSNIDFHCLLCLYVWEQSVNADRGPSDLHSPNYCVDITLISLVRLPKRPTYVGV